MSMGPVPSKVTKLYYQQLNQVMMTRRSFIAKALVGGAAIVAVGVVKWKYWRTRTPPFEFPLVLSSFCDEETVRKIGLRYMALVPGESSQAALLARLSAEIDHNPRDSADTAEIASEIELKTERDFRSEKILIINNWIISRTEARQCALLALS
jgi:hypothetical protein